jgi:hypothetical protein
MVRDVPCGEGDVWDQVGRWLGRTGEALSLLDERAPLDDGEGPRGTVGVRPWVLDELPQLLVGAELATARLIVAGLDPDVEQVLHG